MITKHFKIGVRVLDPHDILNECLALQDEHKMFIDRIKIEKDNNFFPLSEKKYLECHVKIRGTCNLSAAWVRSRNPKDVTPEGDVYFWNRRVYQGNPEEVMPRLHAEVLDSKAEVLDLKFEQVVFDSNRDRDRWWA